MDVLKTPRVVFHHGEDFIALDEAKSWIRSNVIQWSMTNNLGDREYRVDVGSKERHID